MTIPCAHQPARAGRPAVRKRSVPDATVTPILADFHSHPWLPSPTWTTRRGKRWVLIGLLFLALPACALFHRPPRPVHAPPDEAARFAFPATGIPEEGLRSIPGEMARAIQLAMEDFYPWDKKPPPPSHPDRECLYRRESYDVYAAPHQEGVILVSIVLSPRACGDKAVPHDMGALYAIDTRGWRILAVQH